MRAKNLTEPGKKRCSNEDCNNELPNTMFAPAIKSTVTNKEICPDCRVMEFLIASSRARNMEI